MQSLEFIAEVHDGVIYPSNHYTKFLKAQEGKQCKITLNWNIKKRSRKQNNYMWAIVDKYIVPMWQESDPAWDSEGVYDELVKQFGYRIQKKLPDGAIRYERERTSKFTPEKYSDLFEKTWQYCAETLGIYVPSPQEYAEGIR